MNNNKVLVEIIKPEAMEWLELMGKQGLVRLLDDKSSEPKSDDEIVQAIERVRPMFSVNTQWVAVYRVLVDYYGFPRTCTAFCKRIKRMMPQASCNYQTIQKGIISVGILASPYEEWERRSEEYTAVSFQRQLNVARAFLRELGEQNIP